MSGKIIKRTNTSTIQDKFMVGYQGWFTCAGDGPPIHDGHHGWLHWFSEPLPDGGHINTDLWPDLSEYSPSELYPAPGLKYPNGDQAFLFSSRNPKTVQRHFHWMAKNGVDGAFLQRFVCQLDVEAGGERLRNQRDEIGDYVRDAAEKEGRAFAIMYDVAGTPPDRIEPILKADWIHLLREKQVLDSPNYLKEKSKPVVVIWGMGFGGTEHEPETMRAVTTFMRSVTPGGVYIMAGVPAHWRTSSGDAHPNPRFCDVWLEEFDALSPWTVGRYGNEEDADRFAEEKIKEDLDFIKRRNEEGGHRHIDYIPVVLPGGSGHNTSEGHWHFNDIKRNGGRFLWRQIYNARRLGVKTLYGAMWDEYDEGTAYLPVVPSKRQLPVLQGVRFMALDEDGHDLPSDWYMRICGYAAEVLHGERVIQETFPRKEIEDFWSTRPKYESPENNVASGSGASFSGGGQGQSYQEWLAAQQKYDGDAPPPPPYSLEAAPSAEPIAIAPLIPQSTRPASGPAAAERDSRPPVSQSSRPSGPPPVNTTFRPPPVPASSRPTPSQIQSPQISSLAQDFSRQHISMGQSSTPPPPVHPTRPPSSQPVSPPTSQQQWPPTDWNVNRPAQPAPMSTYPGQQRYDPPTGPPPPPVRPRPSSGAPPGQPYQMPSTYSPPQSPPPANNYQSSGPLFPRPQHGEGSYYNNPPPQQQQYTYQPYNPTAQHSQQFPQPSPSPGPSYQGSSPPPAQPYGQVGSYSRPPAPASFYQTLAARPTATSNGGPIGKVFNAADETKRQVEKQFGSLSKTGSKLLNKWTK